MQCRTRFPRLCGRRYSSDVLRESRIIANAFGLNLGAETVGTKDLFHQQTYRSWRGKTHERAIWRALILQQGESRPPWRKGSWQRPAAPARTAQAPHKAGPATRPGGDAAYGTSAGSETWGRRHLSTLQRDPRQERLHLGLAITSVTAESPDRCQLSRLRPPGDRLRVNAEHARNLCRRQQRFRVGPLSAHGCLRFRTLESGASRASESTIRRSPQLGHDSYELSSPIWVSLTRPAGSTLTRPSLEGGSGATVPRTGRKPLPRPSRRPVRER